MNAVRRLVRNEIALSLSKGSIAIASATMSKSIWSRNIASRRPWHRGRTPEAAAVLHCVDLCNRGRHATGDSDGEGADTDRAVQPRRRAGAVLVHGRGGGHRAREPQA